MKKVFLFVIIAVMALVSCSKQDSASRISVYEFNYKGHTYIEFDDRQHAYSTQILHSPDCKKCFDMFD